MTLVAKRPGHGEPRPYQFPNFGHSRLANGIDVIAVNLPERELLTGVLFESIGAGDEHADEAGLTVLMARAMTEGTQT
ncbi:MAG TPA: hypothetical protein VFP19_10420, partial [Candidatus Limnocylindrales bacterium]|nr:hypothetical protein [Candidatus Limnocylindrales bacterium]